MRRSSNGYSANSIGPSEIESWCRLSGVTLRPWELLALDKMEIARLEFLHRDREKEDVIIDEQPVTPKLVKALFG